MRRSKSSKIKTELQGAGAVTPAPFHLDGGECLRFSDYLRTFGRVVTFSPNLAAIIGRNEALLFSQLVYWSDHIQEEADGWIYKDSKELEYETSLTYREQSTARKNLTDLGFIIEDRRPLEHTIYFKVDFDVLNEFINKQQIVVSKLRSTRTGTVSKRILETAPNVVPYKEHKSTSESTEHNSGSVPSFKAFRNKWHRVFGVLPGKDKKEIAKYEALCLEFGEEVVLDEISTYRKQRGKCKPEFAFLLVRDYLGGDLREIIEARERDEDPEGDGECPADNFATGHRAPEKKL